MRKTDWAALERKIGYRFTRPALLKQALTHRSHSAQHNERQEFLGDALLETIISNYLYHKHPKAPEGDLTRMRAALVKGSKLASIAKSLHFGDYLQLGSGELKSGGTRREGILADAVEALIAAVYLDSDFSRCESFTLALFSEALASLPDIDALKDPKTRLQEYLQGHNFPLPIYRPISESGPDHARIFTIEAQTHDRHTTASASSLKKAEQAAAEILLSHYLDKA